MDLTPSQQLEAAGLVEAIRERRKSEKEVRLKEKEEKRATYALEERFRRIESSLFLISEYLELSDPDHPKVQIIKYMVEEMRGTVVRTAAGRLCYVKESIDNE